MSASQTLAKVGKKVQVTRRNGQVVQGVVTSVDSSEKGDWVTLNIGDKKKAVPLRVRPSQLSKPV